MIPTRGIQTTAGVNKVQIEISSIAERMQTFQNLFRVSFNNVSSSRRRGFIAVVDPEA